MRFVIQFTLGLVLIGLLGISQNLYAQAVVEMKVRGNAKVEADAILTMLETKKGDILDESTIRDDIKTLYDLGYFSDIKIYKSTVGSGVGLIVEVVEKPSVMEIRFDGLEEVTQEDISEKLNTKLYSILNEATVTSDLRIIERQYLEKGFYLAQATYTVEKFGTKDHEVALVFHVDEGGKVQVGSVHILGNEYFSDAELIDKFFSKPITRTSTFSTPGSVYHDDFVSRDLEVLSFLYRDQGFAEVKVAKPVKVMDTDRQFVRVTMEVEEGIQYSVGSIDITGDVLYPKEDLKKWMQLKKGDLFRYSRFRRDVEMLVDKYGDKGYAFADVNTIHRFDRENKLVHLNYNITKGEKVYFGTMSIVGNTKTRDNVIRRELEVTDSDLYSGTKLSRSKANINRLGFFEEVKAKRERDPDRPNVLNYSFEVKEKPTGQLQAAVGFSPGASSENSWFGQGTYKEENQSGKGWKVNLTGRWNGGKNYNLELGFTDPRVDDSHWSFGFSAFFSNSVEVITDGVDLQERKVGGSVTVGRRIIERIRGSLTYRLSKITQDADSFVLDRFKEEGIASTLVFALTRNTTNNYLDPSSGTKIRASQGVTGGVLGGDREYLETNLSVGHYIPFDFTETYRTYLRLSGVMGILNRLGNERIPFSNRYRLGGPMDLRAYEYRSIGPKYSILQAPGDYARSVNNGGTKKLLFQFEYFFPIIQDANIKGLFFHDVGRVYREDEPMEFTGFKRDFGFGFRWITPIAPFRFEWAYPVENGEVGDMEFIFYLGF